MGKVVLLLLLAFVITLGVIVGSRMSVEAMAVVVGVVCGVAAGIPMSLLIMLALRRRERQAEETPYPQTTGRYPAPSPPVVVIQGGAPVTSSLPPPYYPMHTAVNEPVHRQFRVIGGGED
jgi:hypothetical protein